jgi:hypothetical protein
MTANLRTDSCGVRQDQARLAKNAAYARIATVEMPPDAR